jgi:hypothetical protein
VPAEEVERTHGHSQIGFFRYAFDDAVKNGGCYVGVNLHPAGIGEHPLHGGFGTDNKKIDHVARIAVFVANTPRNLGEEGIVDAGD